MDRLFFLSTLVFAALVTESYFSPTPRAWEAFAGIVLIVSLFLLLKTKKHPG